MDTLNHLKLRVERIHATAVVRALLTAIFFHRRLDNLEPTTLDVLDTHVAAGLDPELEREVESKVEEFGEIVDSGADSGEIAVVFLQRKNRKGWFAVTEALVPWEEHLVSITFVTRATTNPLPGALLQILTFCADRKGNVPPLVGTSDQNNLSHQILISPPSPTELFAPSSPPRGSEPRAFPPPPRPSTAPVAAVIDSPVPLAARSASPASAMGYLGQAKDGFLAGAKAAGAGVGWGGRAVGAAFGGRG